MIKCYLCRRDDGAEGKIGTRTPLNVGDKIKSTTNGSEYVVLEEVEPIEGYELALARYETDQQAAMN